MPARATAWGGGQRTAGRVQTHLASSLFAFPRFADIAFLTN